MVSARLYTHLSDGSAVTCYTIANKKGEYTQLLDYGASIYSVHVRDGSGILGDVVLGCPDGQQLEHFFHSGVTIGRCANRIKNGSFSIEGKKYQLLERPGIGFIHGGRDNYAKKVFHGEIVSDSAVRFSLTDKDTVGFGCDAYVSVTYRFTDSSELELSYDMYADGATILNPTNHVFFNLAGKGSIQNHTLRFHTNLVAKRDETGIPEGGSQSVLGTPADFTEFRTIAKAIKADNGYFRDGPFYDEFYMLSQKRPQAAALAAEVFCDETGRGLRMYTDMPGFVFYTDPGQRKETGKNGMEYDENCGFCLESGFIPNAVNCPSYASPVFHPGEHLTSKTIYAFFAGESC